MKRVALLFVLQAGAILAWAGHEEVVRRQSPTFRIPLRPFDPYDVLRGRYFGLNPTDGAIDGDPALVRDAEAHAGDALVGFCARGDLYRVCAIRPRTDGGGAEAAFWVRGHVSTFVRHDQDPSKRGEAVRVDLGLRRFFIPNRAVLPARENEPGWELEVSHRPGRTLLPRRLWFRGKPVEF